MTTTTHFLGSNIWVTSLRGCHCYKIPFAMKIAFNLGDRHRRENIGQAVENKDSLLQLCNSKPGESEETKHRPNKVPTDHQRELERRCIAGNKGKVKEAEKRLFQID